MKDILEQYETDTLEDVFNGWMYGNDDFELVSEEITGYDEGTLHTEIIVKHKESGRFFKHENITNSWADYDEGFDLDNVVEVQPVKVEVIKYQKIENNG